MKNFYSARKAQNMDRIGALKGRPFGIFQHFCRKLKGDPLESLKNFRQSLTMPKKLKGAPFGIFQHPFCHKTSKKREGGPFEDFFSKKSHNAEIK